ncbi:MAG TPA: dienelactone hydrolase family protein [Thermoanaerobaculia bacterium]|jgi:dienelactone hydrolase|nr:dienelactone hydrolase family protein [Thermoanaerobaculia bacterium]
MTVPLPFLLETPGGSHRGLVDLPEAPGERPAVVICPGSAGLLEWAFFPYLATLLAARGFVVVRVDGGLGDLLSALAATGREIAPERVDPSRLGLFGHGLGGGAAVLAAALPEWRDRLGALVTWAATSATAEPDLLDAAFQVAAPWLLVHGEADTTVPVAAAGRLFERAQGPRRKTELLRLPGADHALGARHPFAAPNPRLIQALNATQRWFRRHLS